METIMNQTISTSYVSTPSKSNLFSKFFTWCDGQEHNRYGWVGAIVGIHGTVVTPLTMFAVVLAGNNMFFWSLVLLSMGSALITNLAALPTKVTIPVFVFSVLIDIAVVVSCLAIGFDITKAYI